jgi:hypothetical protein
MATLAWTRGWDFPLSHHIAAQGRHRENRHKARQVGYRVGEYSAC